MLPINNAANSLRLGSKSIPNTSHQVLHTQQYLSFLLLLFFVSIKKENKLKEKNSYFKSKYLNRRRNIKTSENSSVLARA